MAAAHKGVRVCARGMERQAAGGWMDGRTDGRMDGRTYTRARAEKVCTGKGSPAGGRGRSRRETRPSGEGRTTGRREARKWVRGRRCGPERAALCWNWGHQPSTRAWTRVSEGPPSRGNRFRTADEGLSRRRPRGPTGPGGTSPAGTQPAAWAGVQGLECGQQVPGDVPRAHPPGRTRCPDRRQAAASGFQPQDVSVT